MSSENERLVNSGENDSQKKHRLPYSHEVRKLRSNDDSREFQQGSNRYFSPPSQLLHRSNINPQMARNVMVHSGSPLERPHIKERLSQPEDSDLTDAMIFLNRIKDEYVDNLHVYDNFLETMRDFKFEKIDADEVCKAIRILFKDKPYLVRLFDEYLPHHLRFCDNARNYELQQDRAKYNQFRAPTFMNKPPVPMHMGQMPPNANIQMARMGHNMHHHNFIPRPPIRQSPPSMIQIPVITEPAMRLKQETPVIESETPKRKMANEFIQLVKKRYLNRPLVYKQFVELLQNSKNSFEKLFTQVSSLLSETPDLVEKFARNFKAAQPLSEPTYNSESDPLKKIKHILAKKDVLEQFLKTINFYNQNYLSATDLIQIVEPIIQDKENMNALKSFIKFEDVTYEDQPSKYRTLEKIGSYRIYDSKITGSDSISSRNEVLNNMCKCIPTHESEEDTYVFRNKNHSEDLVARVIDERSEADLIMDRLKYLIIKLESIFECLDDSELEMEDLQMPSALVKETLKAIYDSKSNEILEAILTTPKKAIPVVLTRINKVYRENSLKLREYRKFWRNIVEEHYYKAYDTEGSSYRSQEKNCLSSRYILSISDVPFSIKIEDDSVLNFIKELFVLYVESNNTKETQKTLIADQIFYIESIFKNIKAQNLNIVIDFKLYLVYYYILILYSRFFELRQIKFEKIESNPMAVSINLQEEVSIEDRYKEMIESAKDLMNKVIDADRFEEYVRRLTDCLGYKLYNLKKIISKIEKQISLLIDGGSDVSQDEDDLQENYTLLKTNNILTICLVSNDQLNSMN